MINKNKENLFFECAIMFSVATFFCFCILIRNLGSSFQHSGSYARYFLEANALRPEPFERFCFISGAFYLPIIAIISYFFLVFIDAKLNNKINCSSIYFSIAGVLLSWAAIFIFGYYLIKGAELGDIYTYRLLNSYLSGFFSKISLLLFLYFVFSYSRIKRYDSKIPFAIGIGLLVVTSFVEINTDNIVLSSRFINHHFSLILGAVNQVAHGRTILVDINSNYGLLYPYFAALFVKIFSPTIINLSLFFVVLIFFSFLFIYLSLCEKIGYNSWLGLLLFTAILGISHPFYGSVLLFTEPVTYYQYFPIRTIFGSFFIWFSLKYLKNKSALNYIVAMLMCGIGFLWNLDSGVPLVAAWLGFLIYDTVSRNELKIKEKIKQCLIHVSVVSLTLVLLILAYNNFSYSRTHKIPSWEGLFEFQKLFYKSGYFMLPMKILDLWNIVAVIYLSVLLHCLVSLFKKSAKDNERFYFFIVLYGVGIFSYYQGRSIVTNLLSVSYPALILLACLISEFSNKYQINKVNFKQVIKNKLFNYDLIKIFSMIFILNYGVVVFSLSIPALSRQVKYNVRDLIAADNKTKFSEAVVFINANKKSNEILIFSPVSDYLYYKTNTFSPLPFSSLNEVATVSQFDNIKNMLISKMIKQVFVFEIDNLKVGNIDSMITPTLQEHYRLIKKIGDNGSQISLYETL